MESSGPPTRPRTFPHPSEILGARPPAARPGLRAAPTAAAAAWNRLQTRSRRNPSRPLQLTRSPRSSLRSDRWSSSPEWVVAFSGIRTVRAAVRSAGPVGDHAGYVVNSTCQFEEEPARSPGWQASGPRFGAYVACTIVRRPDLHLMHRYRLAAKGLRLQLPLPRGGLSTPLAELPHFEVLVS